VSGWAGGRDRRAEASAMAAAAGGKGLPSCVSSTGRAAPLRAAGREGLASPGDCPARPGGPVH